MFSYANKWLLQNQIYCNDYILLSDFVRGTTKCLQLILCQKRVNSVSFEERNKLPLELYRNILSFAFQ